MIQDNEESWDSELTGKERLFVLNFATSDLCFFNGTQSYTEAYTKYKAGDIVYRPDYDTAAACASRMLKKAKIKKAIRLLLRQTQPEIDESNSYKLLHDLVIQATYNPADIIDEKGRLKTNNLEELGELAKCVEQIVPTQFGVRVILSKRSYAQEKLLKYYDLIRDTPEIQAELPVVMVNDKEDIDAWNKKEGA